MSSVQQNQTMHLVNMENNGMFTQAPIEPPQRKSFFDHLNHDIRYLIYEEMLLPPFSDQYLGFVLSCRQAKAETERAVFRRHSALQYIETVKDHLDAEVSVENMEDLTKAQVSIKIRQEITEKVTNSKIRTIVQALLPVLRSSPFAKITIIFSLDYPNYNKTLPEVFYDATLDLVRYIREDFGKGPAADKEGSATANLESAYSYGSKWATRIGFAFEYVNGYETYHRLHGSQYTCGGDMSLLLEEEYPDHTKDIRLEGMPFLYFMRSANWHKVEFGMVSPTRWTARGARAVHLVFLRKGKMGKGHLMTKYCSSPGIGQGIEDNSVARQIYGAIDPLQETWFWLNRFYP